jgi:hypothetical protein
VRDRQTVLRGQLTELFMGEAHDYRIRMIIKQPGAVSTEIFPVTSKRAGARPDCGSATTTGIGARFWMDCRQIGNDLMPAYRELVMISRLVGSDGDGDGSRLAGYSEVTVVNRA